MKQVVDLSSFKDRMDSVVSSFKKDAISLRTGRASAVILDPVKVDVYGSRLPLNQIANVAVPDSRMLLVSVWDKSMVSAVERAIREANLGFNPIVEGQNLRIPIPELNEERRLSLVKVAQGYVEKAKIAIRNVRRDGMEFLKKSKKNAIITEDETDLLFDKMQKMTDEAINKIDILFEEKKEEIMRV
ncbi:ribosome recycling factor [Liberibacter crescens]|uniref:ribosome recycling factor n=1 Tax=Liberibacter crescens TaxID=1273132 RepID=UPI0007633319|nr:ribosome recycling factor [Liberibacter crescens]AMC12342.1 ribosome-recycling factor [Liberibacter crescens]